MSVQLIEGSKKYNPKLLDDTMLQEDFKIVNSWYMTIKQGKKLKHSLKTVKELGIKIMRELLSRGKVAFHPQDMRPASREFSALILGDIVKNKLNVEPPFGDLIYENKVKALVFPEDLSLTDIYLLVQDGKALGYIRFGALPDKVTKPTGGAPFGTYHYKLIGDMFKRTRKYHKITDVQREQLWGDQQTLWLYPIRDFFPLEPPKQLSLSIDMTLPKDLKPEDINPGYLKKVNDFTLVKIHGWLHNGYYEATKKKLTIEKWVNAHAFVVDEMINRKMEHRPWSELDEKSKEFQVHKFSKVEDYLQDFTVRKPYAMIAGSVFVCGEGRDLDVIVRDDTNEYFKEAVLHFLESSNIEDVDFVFSANTSSFTNHINLYDYGLTRNPRSEVYLSKIKLYNLDLQMPSFVNPQPKVYMKKLGGTLKFFIREDLTLERDGIIEFKLKQMLPLHYDLEIIYGKYVPKSFKPIYWDVYQRVPELEFVTMSIAERNYKASLQRSRIKVGKHFPTMKPARATKPGEPTTIDSFVAAFKPKDFPVYIQKKWDGINTEIHRSGDTVRVITEDGKDITHRVPQTVEQVKKLNHNKFAILAEAEAWENKHHLAREATSGYFMSKETPDDSHIVFNVYDAVFTGSHGDITKKNVTERLKVLDTFNFKQSTNGIPVLKYKLNKAPTEVASTLETLRSKSNKLRMIAGSEGVVAKPHWGVYDLSGRRTEQIKFHNSVSFVAKILERVTTKTPGVYVYKWAVKAGGLKPREKHKVVISGDIYVHGGNTDSTAEKFNKGDLLVIEAETINFMNWKDTNEVRMTAWVPRVMKERTKNKDADSIKAVVNQAKKEHVLAVKIKLPDGTSSFIPQEEFKLYMEGALVQLLGSFEEVCDVYSLAEEMEGLGTFSEFTLQRFRKEIPIPKEVAERERKWNSISLDELASINPKSLPEGFFVLVNHFRGKGVHDDLRGKENGTADGWTISSAWAGKIKEPVDTFSEAKAIQADKSVWKFSSDMPPTKHVFATTKPKHPLAWLTQVKNIHKEGEVGATRFEEGLFLGRDWGLRYLGAGGKGSHGTSKPWFYEYFLRGRKFNKKVVFRLLEAPKGNGEVKVKMPIFWQAWVAKDQYPYVLTRAARLKRDWIPLHGRSALPPEIEALIPSELRYWEKRLSKEATFDMMDRVYNYLIEKDWLAANKLPIKETKKMALTGKEVPFILQYEWWKGPKVIRGMRQNLFYIKLQDGSEVQAYSFRDKRPDIKVDDPGITSTIHKVKHGPLRGQKPTDWMSFEGEIPAGHPGHPPEIKKLPLHVEVLDRGKVQVIEDGDMFKSLQFKGKLLKGYYILRREGPEAKFWVWEKSKLPTQPGKTK